MCLRVGSPVAVTRCVYVVIPQGLSPFSRNMAIRWLHRMSDAPQEEFQRARGWLVNLMNGAAGRVINDWQHGCPEIVPLLRAIPFWQPGTFPWAAHITSQFDAIKAEMLALRGRGESARGGAFGGVDCELTAGAAVPVQPGGFQPYRAPRWSQKDGGGAGADDLGAPGTDTGDWNVFYLHLHNADYQCVEWPEN